MVYMKRMKSIFIFIAFFILLGLFTLGIFTAAGGLRPVEDRVISNQTGSSAVSQPAGDVLVEDQPENMSIQWFNSSKPEVLQGVALVIHGLNLHPDRMGSAKRKGARRIEALLEKLREIEHDGGWTYTGPTRLHTFNTAPILLLLVKAKAQGFEVANETIFRAAAFLERNRVGGKSVFHYGTRMEHMTPEKKDDVARASSCFRSPLCELALHAAGKAKGDERLRESLQVFFDGLGGARSTVKIFESYVDPTVMQDSYRYFFGVWYAARVISMLPEKSRAKYAGRLSDTIRPLQELDGSFADSLMVGKTSSTALALLALAELRSSK